MGDVSILLERDGRVARVRIDNPPLNILTTDVREALFRCVHRLAEEGGPDVVVLEGAGGRAFSVGSDIKSFPEDEVGAVNKIRFEQYLLDRITTLPQLTVAKLNGHVLGGGAELMLACDLRIAAEGTQIGFPEIKLGALPAAGGTQRLMRELGPARARELVYLGDSIDADEAYRIGLINRVVPAERLDEATEELVSALLERPANALTMAKRCLAEGLSGSLAPGQTVETEAFAALFNHPNIREGLAAFQEKRKPTFRRSSKDSSGDGGDLVRTDARRGP